MSSLNDLYKMVPPLPVVGKEALDKIARKVGASIIWVSPNEVYVKMPITGLLTKSKTSKTAYAQLYRLKRMLDKENDISISTSDHQGHMIAI